MAIGEPKKPQSPKKPARFYATGGFVDPMYSTSDPDAPVSRANPLGKGEAADVSVDDLTEGRGFTGAVPVSPPIEIEIKNALLPKLEQAEEAIELLKQIAGQARADAGWDEIHKDLPPDISQAVDILNIHSEVAEAGEAVRTGAMDEHLPQFSGISVELVDILLRVFGFAHCHNIDIARVFAEKLEYNARRADHKAAARNAPGGKKW